MTTKIQNLARVNNMPIQVVENENGKFIPIKPICEILGIDHNSQRQKLNDDDFLSSVAVQNTATGSDGKDYEMVCIPYQFIFGWLFTINPKKVKEEAREAVAKYRIECYNALYLHFNA